MARPQTVDLGTVRQILAEAEEQGARVLSDEVPTQRAIRALGQVGLEELDGSMVALGTLWDQRPAVLVFLRHYG